MKLNSVVATIFMKEMTDILRDKRTILAGIILPIFLLPASLFLVSKEIKIKSANKDPYKIGIEKTDIHFDKLSAISQFKVIPNSSQENLRDGKIDIFASVTEDKIYFTVDSRRVKSSEGFAVIKSLYRIQSIDSADVGSVYLDGISPQSSAIPMLFPIIALMFCAVSSISAAADLFAGEKERMTLEPLFATPASRIQILTAKYLAVSLLGLIQVASFLAGLFISVKLSGAYFHGITIFQKSHELILTAISLILMSSFFASIHVLISIFAKSIREVQTISIPFMALLSFFVYHTLMTDIPLNHPFELFIPILSSVLTIKILLTGIFSVKLVAIGLISTVLHISVILILCYKTFTNEKMIFRS